MQLRTLTTLAAVTTTVSALAPPPAQNQAVAAIGPQPTQPPAFPGSLRSEPRPRVVKQKRDDIDEPIDIDTDYEEDDDFYPPSLSTTLRPLYSSCGSAYLSYMTGRPQPSGKLEDWLETALYQDMDMAFSTSDDAYKVMCGTYTSPLTPPASLAKTYSAYSSESASYVSAHLSEVSSLASACKPVHQDVVISLMMPHKDYEACTKAYNDYMVVYASLACEEDPEECSLTSEWPAKTTGYGMGATTTDATGAGATTAAGGASGSAASAAASSTTASGGAPKQTFAAAAVLGGLVAAVAAL